MKKQSLFVKKMAALTMTLMILVASSATRIQGAATPELTPQQIEAVIEDAFAGLVSFDAQRVVQHYADDAVLEDPVGTPPMQGKQAITAYLETFPTLFNQMKLYSLDIKPGGRKPPSHGGYVLPPRRGKFSSWKASVTSVSISRGRFKQRNSSLIWHIFWTNYRVRNLGSWADSVSMHKSAHHF